jgi:hypothetical protein
LTVKLAPLVLTMGNHAPAVGSGDGKIGIVAMEIPAYSFQAPYTLQNWTAG